MPHLVIEVTRELLPQPSGAKSLLPVLADIHNEFSCLGFARLEDMKSRVVVQDAALAGDDEEAQFIVATLTMTQDRPHTMQRAMADLIRSRLHQFIESQQLACSWQCCVFFRHVGTEGYIKSQSR
ncbi:hypothetical protein HUX88_19310 [Duganella sp. BJB1802]|uniref:hypothetical protein n=1 Tax=Duganella sp. BJB1802 TaxID=2744575 RepID=UPI0015931C62|nr:hypothetical protein [Duganella sp. BJB1802]NVD72672.1 hypothetical protein [Duganella sp. BJB1802]